MRSLLGQSGPLKESSEISISVDHVDVDVDSNASRRPCRISPRPGPHLLEGYGIPAGRPPTLGFQVSTRQSTTATAAMLALHVGAAAAVACLKIFNGSAAAEARLLP